MEKKSDRTIIDTCKPLIKHSTKILVRKRKESGKFDILYIVNIVAFCLSIISTILFWFTDAYNQMLLQNIVLKNDTLIKEWYFNPPVNKIIKVYVFNYTNFDNFTSGYDTKLHVNEVGPLVYEEIVKKTNVKYEGFTITFNENRSHIFLPELSSKSEDEIITCPNIALISAIPNVIRMGFFAKVGFNTILSATRPNELETLTLRDFIHGHTNDFMNAISKFKWDFSPEDIGILAQRRGVTKKSLSINSGIENSNDVGQVVKLGDKTSMNIWKSEECNAINASDGVFYGPEKIRNKKGVQVYLPEFCRSLPLEFRKKSFVLNNIPAYYYEAPENTFTYNNKNYCELKSIHKNHINGVLEVSDCLEEKPPAFISHPHFMEGDDKLFEHIDGLKPNRSLHNSFVYLHPRLSVPLYGVSRMQLNLRVNHFKNYYKKFPDGLILPLAWIETTTSKDVPKKFKQLIYLSSVFANNFEIFIKFGSLITMMISLSLLIVQLYKLTKETCQDSGRV
ncbi:hypothetical protein PVAND_007085 [Polypedilum vanderplanki]|uniref:Uncharacterized protein n=1 Tax=Polypedilum vanderplanki TaxID=319348 RepID=A0A9J6C557_POLVA|nr:hypothetical protein PVAND_007085 [Polypedilum vanderplanki]